MLKCNFVIILYLFLILLIDAIDEDLFDDLWKNAKPSTSKNSKKQKFIEMSAIKEEIVVNNENAVQQNVNKIEMEDTTIKLSQKMKKEQLEEQNKNLNTKRKMPKIELEQLSEVSFQNAVNEQDEQDVSSTDQSNSADDEDNIESEKRNEMETLNKFNLMKKELRKESVYKKLTNFQFECEIAKKLGTNRTEIYKLKRKLGQTRKYTIKKVTNKNNMETMTELIRKFDQLKKEKIYGFKYDKQKRNKIEREIANELGINRNKIYKWKNEIGLLNGLSNQQKLEKIGQFEKVREEFAEKFNLKTTKKINGKIAEKIGVVLRTIYRWKRKFGFTSQKTNMDADVLSRT